MCCVCVIWFGVCVLVCVCCVVVVVWLSLFCGFVVVVLNFVLLRGLLCVCDCCVHVYIYVWFCLVCFVPVQICVFCSVCCV